MMLSSFGHPLNISSKAAPVHSASTPCFAAMLKRLSILLPLMLASLPCFALGQMAQGYATSPHSEQATQTLPPLTLPVAKGIPAPVRHSTAVSGAKGQKVIVIGFVGGFARGNDQKHPEVQFAEFLRGRYGSAIFAGVFANHQGREALQTVLRLLGGNGLGGNGLGSNGSGGASVVEKDSPRIILYGHSWGAAETLIFARELEKIGIPVFLTIQVDSIAKPGYNDARIPSNVANAINLYQSRGPLHGQTEVFAAAPARTTIIGNLHMTYAGHTINCDNYPWFPRTFNRPHHEIENDPRVWDLAASLIDSAFRPSGLTARESTFSDDLSVLPPLGASFSGAPFSHFTLKF